MVPSDFYFFQMPKSKWFGIVPKHIWDQRHHLDDNYTLSSLERQGIDLSGFGEPMECFLEHTTSYKKGLKHLLKLGFQEMDLPPNYQSMDEDRDEDF